MNTFQSAILALSLLIPTVFSTSACAGNDTPAESTAIFNGEDLSGWTAFYRYDHLDKDLFTVHDGMLHMFQNKENRSEQTFATLVTDKEYSNYILRLEYQWGEKKFAPRHNMVRDSGVLLHVHGEHGIKEFFPDSVECQIMEGDSGDIWVIRTMVSSRVEALSRSYSPEGELITRGDPNNKYHRFHRSYDWQVEGWNQLEITVKEDYASFSVNGHVVNEAIDMKFYDATERSWKPLKEGKIALQAEGAEIMYRNITLTHLQP